MQPETVRRQGTAVCDDAGKIIVDENQCMTCRCEDDTEYKILIHNINLPSDILLFTDNNIEIEVDITGLEFANIKKNIQSSVNDAQFSWNDASTKLFLSMYNMKKDLVASRKIRTHKLMWKLIAEDMHKHGYNVTELQIQNKFKTLERAYKNMIHRNKMTGQGRTTCSYEDELTDILGHKHSIIPLAVSGRDGTVIRDSVHKTLAAPVREESPIPSTSMQETVYSSNETEVAQTPASESRLASAASTSTPRSTRFQKGTTAKSLQDCKYAIEKLTAEIKENREIRERYLDKIHKEYIEIKKAQEKYFASTELQRQIAIQQREEKINLLKELINMQKR